MDSVYEQDKEYAQDILGALAAANGFMHTLYHAGLWLLDSERDALIRHGSESIAYFKRLAGEAYAWDLTRWKIQPQMHFFAEVLHSLKVERLENLPSISPLSTSTQVDEDFVGRVATASRVVHGRTIHVRTIQRHLLHLRTNW